MDRFTTKENAKAELLDCIYCSEHSNCYSNMSCNAVYNALSKLRYYERLEEQGRLIVLPRDGMLYHIEESGSLKWIGNKPIQDIVFKCGWGLTGIEYSLWDLGKTFFLSRKEAETSIKDICIRSCETCYANDMKHDEIDNPCWNCKGDYSEWFPKK